MSSSVLYERQRDLTNAGPISKAENEIYALTSRGASLGVVLKPLDMWSNRGHKVAPRRRTSYVVTVSERVSTEPRRSTMKRGRRRGARLCG